MLHKIGIVAAAATAGVLAISPMAFAHDHHHHHHHHGDRDGDHQRGLINLQNTNAQVPIQACNNSVIEGVLGILARNEHNRDHHNGKCRLDNHVHNGGHRHHHH